MSKDKILELHIVAIVLCMDCYVYILIFVEKTDMIQSVWGNELFARFVDPAPERGERRGDLVR
ncbi:MAG: hypothetical protein R6V04_01525, partial [bacterium]